MGRYLDIIRRAEQGERYDINDINDQRVGFGRIGRFGRTLGVLTSRCPDHVNVGRWQQAVEDGKRFLARWGEQAEALGWTARDLFGLAQVPDKSHPSYRRLSRYDQTGLVWLLESRAVLELTEHTATIQTPHGHLTYYRHPTEERTKH